MAPSWVKSTTCMPCPPASDTMNAWLSWTLTSRHNELVVAVGKSATITGFSGSEMSMKAVPLERPRITYSVLSDGSTQPQMSFIPPPPTSPVPMTDINSTFSQGKSPAKPLMQGVWAVAAVPIHPNITSRFQFFSMARRYGQVQAGAPSQRMKTALGTHKKAPHVCAGLLRWVANGIRTHDPRHHKPML